MPRVKKEPGITNKELSGKRKVKSEKPQGKAQNIKIVKTEQMEANVKKSLNTKTLSVAVIDTKGNAAGKVNLPEEMFGAKINAPLMAQAVRVYLSNQRRGTVDTKTRAEVAMTTAKWYRQKGTGRARHGAKSAPIFVHGGVAHGPKPRDYSLSLSKPMKKRALFSALTSQLQDGAVRVVDGLDTVAAKTKAMAGVFASLSLDGKKRKVLVVTPTDAETVRRSARNLPGITLTEANKLNTYIVLNNRTLVFMKSALNLLNKTFLESREKSKKQV